MKSRILSAITMLVIAFVVTKPAHAAVVNNNNFTMLNNISAINKVEVRGNVELYISDGETDQVKVYNQYYAESALVQDKNGVLCITSYKPETLVVWITANDLRSIAAYDDVTIKSFGNISKIEFDVELHNNASAQLNLDAFSANVTLTDTAKADLSGTATEFTLKHSVASSVNKYNFAALHYTESKIKPQQELKEAEVADIF